MVIQCNFACGMLLIPYKAGPGVGHSHTEEGTFQMKHPISFPQLYKVRSQLCNFKAEQRSFWELGGLRVPP
ncbi:hypothetical protein OJAV_G00119740 [Oryzias javanicus]|uniref:Uncharacterized protein n=1 Tax=Oryzias javanicus TaxID=123683 RepID=A0A3S2M153_ORYJA|nr:hypothetical protein OJAV_G00119740 [Oryzias javanicus]